MIFFVLFFLFLTSCFTSSFNYSLAFRVLIPFHFLNRTNFCFGLYYHELTLAILSCLSFVSSFVYHFANLIYSFLILTSYIFFLEFILLHSLTFAIFFFSFLSFLRLLFSRMYFLVCVCVCIPLKTLTSTFFPRISINGHTINTFSSSFQLINMYVYL